MIRSRCSHSTRWRFSWATGSATVATVTAAGILQPVTATLSTSHVSLLVLVIGAGSLFFSHVNDAGFWLTKQFFGLSVSQNIKSWSLMEQVVVVDGDGALRDRHRRGLSLERGGVTHR